MMRYIVGRDQRQSFLLPECVADYVGDDNPVRVVDAFMDELDLAELGFGRTTPADSGRPGYHPATLLKLYLCGYLNRVPSSRCLEREAAQPRGALADRPPRAGLQDHRRLPSQQRPAINIKATCRQFVLLCRKLDLFADAVVAIDGSRFKAVNARDKSYTQSVIQRRMEQVEASVARYLAALDTADRHDPGVPTAKVQRHHASSDRGPQSHQRHQRSGAAYAP